MRGIASIRAQMQGRCSIHLSLWEPIYEMTSAATRTTEIPSNQFPPHAQVISSSFDSIPPRAVAADTCTLCLSLEASSSITRHEALHIRRQTGFYVCPRIWRQTSEAGRQPIDIFAFHIEHLRSGTNIIILAPMPWFDIWGPPKRCRTQARGYQ